EVEARDTSLPRAHVEINRPVEVRSGRTTPRRAPGELQRERRLKPFHSYRSARPSNLSTFRVSCPRRSRESHPQHRKGGGQSSCRSGKSASPALIGTRSQF